MDILPIEVLENIFGRLSQKFAASVASIVCKKWNQIILQSSFYTSIRILTEQQLIKFIQMANEKTINNQPIGYYVQQLKLDHHINIKEDTLIKLMKVFPNIHFISGLSYQSYKSDSIYPHLNQLTHFSCWYKNKQWTDHLIYNKEIVKSLDIKINKDMFPFNSQNAPPIHFNLIDNKNLEINWDLPIQLLVLPTFINLIKLDINLYNFVFSLSLDPLDEHDFESINSFGIDERTFESIHSSCPQLTTLTLSNIKMTISKEFHDQSFIPAHQLKELHLRGTFIDPSCYTYFLKKYSHLDSFFINMELQSLINYNDNRSFQLAIARMLFQFSALRGIHIDFYVPYDKYTQGLKKFKNYWPHDEFLMWLKQHSEQITHIKYPCDFTSNDGINIELLQQPTFLTYLTSLSLYLDNAVHLVSTYILQNMDHSIIISAFLKELILRKHTSRAVKNVYIYDFLTVFPNLESLQLHSIGYIYDELGDMFQSGGRWECTKLHHMIRRLSDTDTTILNNKNENDTCKLKHLKIVECVLFFGYGLNDFFKKCYQLKSLDLLNIKYVISTSDTTSCTHHVPPSPSFLPRVCSLAELYFDLSHLYFDRILISKFYCTSWKKKDKKHRYLVNKLIINETLPCRELILNENIYSQFTDQRSCLSLKCKYVDELIFNK
ncbi:unnamed protein product [Cunninghamella echinulata]